MILNTGQRTDIPAFYHEWFLNRIKEGYVYVRNPYYPKLVTKYFLNPDIIDCLCFCTKNPKPMINHLHEINKFNQIWFVTITPYGKDIEPNVPNKHQIIDSFIELSKIVGKEKVIWRYDPIFISNKYSIDYHLRAFESICIKLSNYTNTCIISFIDLYKKVIKNFPEVKEVTKEVQIDIYEKLLVIAKKYNIQIKPCSESIISDYFSLEKDGCQSQKEIEKACGFYLDIPKSIKPARKGCNCILGNDIGQYDTCNHGCKYCYANYDRKNVYENMKNHDKNSPILIGKIEKDDIIKECTYKSFRKLNIF